MGNSAASRERYNEKRRERRAIERGDIEVHFPPSPQPTALELIERLKIDFARKEQYELERKLIPVDVNIDGPIGILHFGDPHVDDPGTDWATLESHIKLVNDTPGLFAANVGDSRNNWVGRLAKLYGEQSVSAEQATILAEHFVKSLHGKWLYLIGGNHDCHAADTECLTARGWIRYTEIEPSDRVLSLDRETGKGVWSPILDIIIREHSGGMVSVTSRSVPMLMTNNHRVLLSKKSHGSGWCKPEYVRAQDLTGRMAIPCSAVNGDDHKCCLTDDQLTLAGWVLTDGSIRNDGSPRISIYQSKPTDAIDDLLSRMGIKYKKTIRHRDISHVCGRELVKPCLPQTEWRIGAEQAREIMVWLPMKGEIPAWGHDLNDRQFSVLLDAIVAGDGSWDGGHPSKKRVAVIHGTKTFLDSLQAIAVQHGWYARISMARGKDYRLNLCRRGHVQLDASASVVKTSYIGKVWCLTVPHGNFMVRRGGAAYFSGNCWSGSDDPMHWITRSAGALYEPSEARLGLRFPNGMEVVVNARHDFAGNSMWNPAHAVGKAAQLGIRDHILICGHKHSSGYVPIKDPADGKVCHCIQVASYKKYDRYAREKGFRDQTFSPCAVTIINPYADTPTKLVQVYWDADFAADILTYMRKGF